MTTSKLHFDFSHALCNAWIGAFLWALMAAGQHLLTVTLTLNIFYVHTTKNILCVATSKQDRLLDATSVTWVGAQPCTWRLVFVTYNSLALLAAFDVGVLFVVVVASDAALMTAVQPVLTRASTATLRTFEKIFSLVNFCCRVFFVVLTINL